jgi:anthraniloyl-CoA monooxygenase
MSLRIACMGGGPGGLYFALLMKKAFPEVEVRVLERNRADDAFGWGVVFSNETLGGFEQADPESYRAITESFAYWDDIETWYGGTSVRSTGHGFCGLSRKRLLEILQARCREVGVDLFHEHEVKDPEALAGEVDLLVACDGVNSQVRARFADAFEPNVDLRPCRFSWLGTTLPLKAFTFIFKESAHGLFHVHAYPFEKGLSTFILECHEDTFHRAGLDTATEADTVAYGEALFADELGGHRLLSNRSIWRQFPTVSCERWHHRNVVLLGDAAHTAHFSIGSGTKLAMEDSIALVEAFGRLGLGDVPAVLEAYESARRLDVLKTQKAAQTSLEWFENSRRYVGQDPVQFSFNLLTRSKRITFDNLTLRDPEFVEGVKKGFAASIGWQAGLVPRRPEDAAPDAPSRLPPPVFSPLRVGGLELMNRVVVSPMCQYSAEDGVPGEWHLVHYGSRALGGAGLLVTEQTNVSPEGRITPGCAGIWNDAQEAAWKRIVDFVHRESGAKIGLQLGHAGRKGACSRPWEGDAPLEDGAWETLGPSAIPYDAGWPAPMEMDRAAMDRMVAAFVAATERADRAGFDLLELHVAHGYLLSSFLSPVSNRREDAYGGPIENRMRFPLEVFDACRRAWPSDRPMAVRLSVTDWLEPEGLTLDESVIVARAFEAHGCDLVDVSSAGNTPESKPVYGRMYQVPFAERIRHEVGVPVMAVGAIFGADHANTILAAGRADLCAMARPHLRDPYLTLHAAQDYDYEAQRWPVQYLPGKRRPKSG